MHLIVLHGVPGVGKRTIAQALSEPTGYPFLNAHHLAVFLGPALGFGSPGFVRVRDAALEGALREAVALDLPGVIMSSIFEASVPPGRTQRHIAIASESGGTCTFVRLTCATPELRLRMTAPDRAALGKWNDFDALETALQAGTFDVPELPAPAFTVDTTGLTPVEAAARIVGLVPHLGTLPRRGSSQD